MPEAAKSINSFFESTCVIIVLAYLLTRGPFIALLGRERVTARQTLLLGAVFGAAGLVELFFASDRFPYDTYTLIVTFATLQGGARVGLMTALAIGGAALFFQPDTLTAGRTELAVLGSVATSLMVRHWVPAVSRRGPLNGALVLGSLVAVALAEAVAILARLAVLGPTAVPFSLSFAVLRSSANGLGVVLLQMIVHDAQVRADGERFRVEAERARTLLAEAKLSALRARLHPHFLFNALTSIAALCRLAPERAEDATIQLGQIMRRALEVDARASVPLTDEIEYVEEFVEIEKLRLGERLRFVWEVDADYARETRLPPFVLQTLVENAIQHGIAPKIGPGTVTVTVRGSRRRVLVAVRDDGVGVERGRVRYRCEGPLFGAPAPGNLGGAGGDRPHGMQIVAEQLCLLYGHRARLRLFGRPDVGTCVLFALPRPSETGRPRAATALPRNDAGAAV